MARPIDAYQAIDIIDEWLDSVGTVMVGKGLSSYGELIGCIEDAPTLTPQNEPLTLEELREMDGEPVYIISEAHAISEWNIPKGVGEIVVAYDVPCAGMKSVIPSVEFIDGKELSIEKYGSDWVAYRRPPETMMKRMEVADDEDD